MADQRPFGNPDKSPTEVGAQVRDRAQETGTQVRDRAQEMVRQGAETATDSYQQGRQQMQAAEHTLEDAIRTKPLQSILMAAGLGMLVTLLWKREETTADYYQRGRQQADDYYQRGRQQVEGYYRQGRRQADDYYQQGRQQVQAAEHTLEDAIRAKPLQATLMATGLGMLLMLLMKR